MKLLALTITLLAALHAEQPQKNIDAGSLYTIIPQIADGASWKTTLILANMEENAVSWTVKFFSDDGKPKEFDIVGRGRSTIFSGVLTANGSVILETPGAGGSLNQGWAEISSSGSDDVGATVIFGTRGIPGRPDYEASVPAMWRLDNDVIIPFDNTLGFVTSLAVVNPSTFGASKITMKAFTVDGALLKTEELDLAQGAKLAFSTADRWPEVRNQRGTIQLTGSSYATAFTLRFHPGGAFTTVLPMSR